MAGRNALGASALGGVLALAMLVPAPATARDGEGDGTGGGNTGDGYEVGVEVTLSGDGAPGGGGTIEVSLPPVCWWEPIPSNISLGEPVDATDPESVYEWYKVIYPQINGSFAVGRLAFPDEQVFLDAIAREKAGEDITWYKISSESEDVIPCSPHVTEVPEYVGGEAAQTYAPFVAGEPPEPAVDPETLAIEARELMVIDEPDVDRNPKFVNEPVGATFVNMPTWFWVTDPEMVGGSAGTRTIRAEVVGTGVWAEVTAETGGLSVSYPGGSKECPPDVALRTWEPGAADTDACTMSFARASVGHADGYPVTASTQWDATWEGEDGEGGSVGGDLDPLQRSTTVNVPVAEVQSLVRSTR